MLRHGRSAWMALARAHVAPRPLRICCGLAITLVLLCGQWLMLEHSARAGYAAVLLAVFVASIAGGLSAGLASAVAGWLLVILFWVEPVGGFRIDDWQDLAAAILLVGLSVFLSVAAVILRTIAARDVDAS